MIAYRRQNVLIAGEESQAICIAFRKRGHYAYSCDIQDCSGGHPEWHIKGDYIPIIKSKLYWDLIIFHPDCTAMATSGNRWYAQGMPYYEKRIAAIENTIKTWELIKSHARKACLENPVSVIFSHPRMKNHQYIQPWQFGHGETKKTGIELFNLPMLTPTDIVDGREPRIHKMVKSINRKKERSKTFIGIAQAMADQWG